MRYPVHKKQHEIEKSRPQKVLGRALIQGIELLIFLAFGIFMIVGKTGLGIMMLWLGICMGIGLYEVILPETSGYLKLGEDIVFHNVFGKLRYRRYQYRDIHYLCIDDCPVLFRKNKNKNTRYTGEEWRSIYGKYVIAINQDNGIMFACSYTDAVWDFLTERCRDTAEKIFNEKEWLEYKQERIALEKKTEIDNGHWEIVSQFDGYVN